MAILRVFRCRLAGCSADHRPAQPHSEGKAPPLYLNLSALVVSRPARIEAQRLNEVHTFEYVAKQRLAFKSAELVTSNQIAHQATKYERHIQLFGTILKGDIRCDADTNIR